MPYPTDEDYDNLRLDMVTVVAVTNSAPTDPDIVSRLGQSIKPLAKVMLAIEETEEAASGSAALAAADRAAIEAQFSALSIVALDPLSGYIFAIQDKETLRTALRVAVNGDVEIDSILLPANSVSYTNLSTTLQGLVFAELDPLTGYVFAIIDPVTGRSALRVAVNGDVEIDSLIAGANSVTAASFAADAKRQALPQPADVISVQPDDWRFTSAGLPLKTHVDGTLWKRLPPVLTPSIRGFNASGTSLQFRKSARLLFRGKRYAGTFDASGTSSINARGTFTTALPSTTGAAVGDYWHFISQSPQTLGGNTYNIGDIAVWDGSALVKKGGPAPVGGTAYTLRQPGDWWIVSVGGTFDGVAYTAGDRIVHVGFQSASGFGYARWVKGNYALSGELFYKGEFDASTGNMPATPVNGEAYQVSVAGTAGAIVWAVGDYAVYENGAWGQVPTETIKTVANAAFISLTCAADASEYEVRRTDKSNTVANCQLSVRKQSSPRRHDDRLVLYSDSMFGVNSVGANIGINAGRDYQVFSFGGGGSEQVLNMLELEIARLGDRYRGRLHGFWHGQNNQPSAVGDSNWCQVIETSLKMSALVGARDKRHFFMSILGMHSMSWDGTRLVNSQLEDSFNKVAGAPLYELEKWYEAMFPGQWVSPRSIMLQQAAASTIPELLFPGMTEAAVVAAYGIAPTRYYAGWSSLPAAVQANPASAVFTGYHSTAGLPTGGAAGDYKIRTANGTVGSLIFNVAGVWTEPAFDTVHTSADGSAQLGIGIGSGFIAASLI